MKRLVLVLALVSWQDLWSTPDQRGQRLMEAGHYAEAATQFADPMRRGVAQFRAGDFKAAAETFGATAGPQLEARLKAVEDATAKVAGDSVLLTVAADEAKKIPPLTIVVKKTTDGWKIDGGSLFNLSPENREQATQRAELSKKLTVITRQMTQEVNDGKYAAAVDAFQEFWTRSVKAAKTNPQAATTAPSTNK